jgi:hypothetical protein
MVLIIPEFYQYLQKENKIWLGENVRALKVQQEEAKYENLQRFNCNGRCITPLN